MSRRFMNKPKKKKKKGKQSRTLRRGQMADVGVQPMYLGASKCRVRIPQS